MRIWLLHVGEELPSDDQPRRFRYGYLADALAQKGHQVLRWAPTFQHAHKIQRFTKHTRLDVSDRYSIQFVHAPGYRSNVSLARWQCYRRLALEFRKLASQYERPNLIVTGIPSLEWCEDAIRFGRRYQIPTVLDVRDLWPDVMLNALPGSLRSLGRMALEPMYRRSSWIARHASAICAVSQSYLDWALRQAGRSPGNMDRVFPLGYEPPLLSEDERNSRLALLRSHGVDPSKKICCFFGLFENSYDLETIVATARRLLNDSVGKNVQFVLCGDGTKMASVLRQTADLPNVVLTGWVDSKTVAVLMQLSHIGLAAYAPHALQSLPNKVFEYLAGGLSVVSSLGGEFDELLKQNQCGVTYRAGDAKSLAESICRSISDEMTLASYRQNSADLFRDRYTTENIYEQYCGYLEAIASSRAQKIRCFSAA